MRRIRRTLRAGQCFPRHGLSGRGPSEDCLYLNVYAPAMATGKEQAAGHVLDSRRRLFGRASSEPRHNGDFLPTKGVVLVTINYRLGVFGFLATRDLAKEANGAAGNYGLMDMVAALQWVKANIAKFGGDPGQCDDLRRERRIVCREHADGFSHGAGTVRTRPSAKAAAAFSDALLDGDTLEDRERRTDGAWVDSLGVKSLADLRAHADGRRFWRPCRRSRRAAFSPVVDGKLLTEPVAETYAAGQAGARAAAGRMESRRRQPSRAARHDRGAVEGHGRRALQ